MPDRIFERFEAQFPLSEIAEFEPPPAYDIHFSDRWVASSLLQKGISFRNLVHDKFIMMETNRGTSADS